MTDTPDLTILEFNQPKQWRKWLSVNYANQAGIWMRLYKKSSGILSITHAEALDQALCFGWIDGQGKKLDEKSWIIKFTPRREKSIWSKRNRSNVERLIKEKQMTIHGLKEIERAKQDGRWEAAYDSQKDMTTPEDFLKALQKDKKAYKFFKTLNRTNIYAIAWRLQTAKKAETRAARLKKLLGMMSRQEKLH